MKLTFKRPFSKSRKRELRRCSKKKSVIALKNKPCNNRYNCDTKFAYTDFCFSPHRARRKVNHLERCAFTDVGPPFDVSTCFHVSNAALPSLWYKGRWWRWRNDVTLFCLFTLCLLLLLSFPFPPVKKQNKKMNRKRVICQILVASRAEILASFRTLNFAPKSLLILPAKRAGSALWYFLCMFIYFVYPFRFATLNKKTLMQSSF